MKRLHLSVLLLLTAATGAAQTTQGGLLLDRDLMTPGEMYELSQTTFNLGTARSMAMAGAFTSLGADLASMAINPAGLGMYRRSEISLTPMMGFEHSENSAPADGSNHRNRFSIGNFGFAINAYEGTGTLTSLTIGIGYNRLADLNYSYGYRTEGNAGSIADVFSKQLDYGGINSSQITGSLDWDRIYPEYWGAVLGYKCGLTDQTEEGWAPTWIGNNADIGHYLQVDSRGYVGEFEISLGANLQNKFYIGASIGIQSIHQQKRYHYAEDYLYAGDGIDPTLDYQLTAAGYSQSVDLDGAGVNFKLGFIYRPVENLRLGFAIHTPTYLSIERSYKASMSSAVRVNHNTENLNPDPQGFLYADESTPTLEDTGSYSWAFTTPTRMLFGISYTFGNRGVISVDYERDWYNGIRIKDNPSGLYPNTQYNDFFRSGFKGSNTVRVGAEFKPLPYLALRAGFGYMGSSMRESGNTESAPMTKSITYYSAGLGFALPHNMFLDLAYNYQTTSNTSYDLFYFADDTGVNASGVHQTDFARHAAALTFGVRF